MRQHSLPIQNDATLCRSRSDMFRCPLSVHIGEISKGFDRVHLVAVRPLNAILVVAEILKQKDDRAKC